MFAKSSLSIKYLPIMIWADWTLVFKQGRVPDEVTVIL